MGPKGFERLKSTFNKAGYAVNTGDDGALSITEPKEGEDIKDIIIQGKIDGGFMLGLLDDADMFCAGTTVDSVLPAFGTIGIATQGGEAFLGLIDLNANNRPDA